MDPHEKMYREITEAFGVPGYEDEVRSVILKYLKPHADEITTDNLGSVIAKKEGKKNTVRILFVAHMDECGFMVKSLTKEGYIRFLPLGGWHPPVALGQRVLIKTCKGPVMGVIGAQPPHGMTDEEKKKPIELDDLWIDAGVSGEYNPAASIPIRPGDPIAPFGPYAPTANPRIALARNWDNRVGCAVLLRIFSELKKNKLPCTVYGAFAVQEEVGLRGAGTVAWKVDPDIAIALDVSQGFDTPGDKDESDARLGRGASILIYDRSMIPHIALRDTLSELADQHKIPYHFSTVMGGYDTGRVHLHKDGVPSCVLGIPSRYIHGFASMVHMDDIDSAARLGRTLAEHATDALLRRLRTFQ